MVTLIKIKAALIKYWWVVLGVLLAIVGLVLGGVGKTPLHEWRDTQDKVSDVEKKRDERIQEVEDAKQARIQEIEEKHAEVLKTLTDDQKVKHEQLRKSPRRLNKYLNSLLPGQ